MEKTWMKVVSLLLSVCLLAAVLSSCKSTGKSLNEGPKETEQSNNAAPSGLPIVKESLTLKYWAGLDQKTANVVKSLNDLSSFKELEKRTGIHIEFLHPPVGQENEQFNLMLAARDLPDMIECNWRGVAGGPARVINDNVILKLNDLIDKNAPNLKKLMGDNPDWKKEAILDDGSYYAFPFVRDDAVLRSFRGYQIRKDWLDKLGLQLPKTINDWYMVLKAFKEKDPNGNGKNDEIPFVQFKSGNSIGFSGFSNFIFAWGLSCENSGFYMDNGKVKFSYIQPAYKDYLTTMRQWYKEGLIDPDYPVVDRKLFDTKMTSEIAGATIGGPEMGFLGYYMNLMKDKNPKFVLEGVEYPIGPAGKSYGWKDKYLPGNSTAITTVNKYQKETVRWLDYAYSDEGRLLHNFGPEGIAYNMKDSKVVFTDTVVKAQEGFDAALSKHGRATTSGPFVQNRAYVDQGRSYFPQQSQAVDRWKLADASLLLPAISPTSEESQKIASIMNEINTYVSEMENKFIMGQMSLDEFDKFANNIKNMRIEDALKIEQAAYDRFSKK